MLKTGPHNSAERGVPGRCTIHLFTARALDLPEFTPLEPVSVGDVAGPRLGFLDAQDRSPQQRGTGSSGPLYYSSFHGESLGSSRVHASGTGFSWRCRRAEARVPGCSRPVPTTARNGEFRAVVLFIFSRREPWIFPSSR